MEYHEAVGYLFDLRRFRIRPGTSATRELLDHLGQPETAYDVVQIAGSNGKGSTASMVASVLEAAGLSVGLYTSPHMDDLRERIQIDGRPITKQAVTEFVAAASDHIDTAAAAGEPRTFFETLTAMAFWAFDRADVDVAVVEVGIGGRHDATSAVEPAASAVTNVTLEHTDVLGDTVEEIARDKAAVAVPGQPLVTGATGPALGAIRLEADNVLAVGLVGTEDHDPDVTVEYGGVLNTVEGSVRIRSNALDVETEIPFPGRHQALNAGIAATLASQVASESPITLDPATVAVGLRRAHWPGRFEVVQTDPTVVLDGAHNPAACGAVAETLSEYDYADLTLVFGAMNDKAHAEMAAELPPAERVFVTEPANDRAESREVLSRAVEAAGHHGEVRRVGSVESALDRALDRASPTDCVLVTGSLYTVAEARTRWSRPRIPKRVPDIDTSRAVLEAADVAEPGVWRMRAKGVHRVLKTRLRPRQAQFLKEELLSEGGECAISSAAGGAHDPVDVVLTGTLAQFRRVIRALRGQPFGLEVVAEQLRRSLGIQIDRETPDYPWFDRPVVMGIVNVTPDSFHDGGAYDTTEAAVERARTLVSAGADIVDVGGESTNPHADPIPAAVERERVIPVLEGLAETDLKAMVSIDTRKAEVASAALDAGADIINDVSGLEDPAMRFLAADRGVPIVVMHSLETPVEPDRDAEYDDVVEDVIGTLRERVRLAEMAGVDPSRIIVDPGLGFGKSAEESWDLLDRLDELEGLGYPILLGHSHKSMFGAIDRYPDEGGSATIAATALGVQRGADIVRVHDVAENVAALRAAEMLDR